MTVLVLDVAADSGGALTVLNKFYEDFQKDKENRYVIVTGVVDLQPADNVEIVKLPWAKKSWFHRLFIDFIYIHKLIDKYKVDRIFSLQNTGVLNAKIPQTLYLHQPLPFCGIQFSLHDNAKFWVYQNLIGKLIIASARKADKVIVQTQWMKDAVIKKASISPDSVVIEPPDVNLQIEEKFSKEAYENTFFYPASNYVYKNHEVIFDAMNELNKSGVTNYKVVLTLTYDELSSSCKEKYEQVKENVELAGQLDLKEVYAYYGKTVLLFPSYIETFGLPLLEASSVGCPIIAASTPFAHEILDNYNKVTFFTFNKATELAGIMRGQIK